MTKITTAIILFSVLALGACSENSPYLEPQQTNKPEKVRDRNETAKFNPSVDILFVVDDSGSMASHQSNLSANIKKFTTEIQNNQILDYHIGVVTTSIDQESPYDPATPWRSGCDNSTTGYSRACGDGRLVRYRTGIPFVERSTPNGLSILEQNLVVGTNGSATEAMFDPVHEALTRPNENTVNAGFMRPDASLAVIFLTDAEDQSDTMDAQSLFDFLTQLKGGHADKIMAYGALVPSNVSSPTCSRDQDGDPPLKVEQFLSLAKGLEFNICDTDYGTKLAHIAADVVQKVGKIMYLSRPPIVDTITVTYGPPGPNQQIIPNDVDAGWTYDPVRNALLFGPKLVLTVQPPGAELEVNFDAGSF